MLSALRRWFVTGFFVTVPLVISVAALVWIFGIIDRLTAPLASRVLGREVPGLGILVTQASELWSFSRRGRVLRRTRLPFGSLGDGLIVEPSADGGLMLAEHGRCVQLDATGTLA